MFNDDDLDKWKMSFLRTCRDIYEAELDGYFPCQFDSCFDFNRKCQFYGLCIQNKNPMQYAEDIPEGYMISFWDVEEDKGDNE